MIRPAQALRTVPEARPLDKLFPEPAYWYPGPDLDPRPMEPDGIRTLIAQVGSGDREARDRLFEQLYDELHRRAHFELVRSGRASLNTTMVVHEAYLRLAGVERLAPEDHAHFMRIAARAMRSVVVDRARRRLAAKRGGGATRVNLASVEVAAEEGVDTIVALDDALSRLEEREGRLAQVVQLKFFAGLSVSEVATTLSVSERTVKRDWRLARAYLHSVLHGRNPDGVD